MPSVPYRVEIYIPTTSEDHAEKITAFHQRVRRQALSDDITDANWLPTAHVEHIDSADTDLVALRWTLPAENASDALAKALKTIIDVGAPAPPAIFNANVWPVSLDSD